MTSPAEKPAPTAEDALCDALLMAFGLGEGNVSMPLHEALDRIRPEARQVLADLEEDGWLVVRADTYNYGRIW